MKRPDAFTFNGREFYHNSNGVRAECYNDAQKCVGWIQAGITQHQQGLVTVRNAPVGIPNEGNFTFKNGTDKAAGTLDYMAMTVEKHKLDLNSSHFTIEGDLFAYNHSGVELRCQGLHWKCIGLFFDYSFKNNSNGLQSQGTVDEL